MTASVFPVRCGEGIDESKLGSNVLAARRFCSARLMRDRNLRSLEMCNLASRYAVVATRPPAAASKPPEAIPDSQQPADRVSGLAAVGLGSRRELKEDSHLGDLACQ